MMRKKKRMFSRSKRAPSRISNVVVGTHIERGTQLSSKELSFSSMKKTQRAQKGMVDQVVPETRSRESESEHARRVNKPHYTKILRRNARIKAIAIVLVVLIAIAAIAGGVGVFAYVGSVADKMKYTDEKALSTLVAPEDAEPTYTLLVGEYYEVGKEYSGPGFLMLARMDEAQDTISLLSVPTNLQVQLSDGAYHQISYAQILGGDKALIEAVSDFCGVSISHIIKTDKDDFVRLVDNLGGISIDVTEEVDDPNAGSIYIPKGTRTLNGEEAFLFCRATNFSTGEVMRAENQAKMVTALGLKLLESESFGFVFALDRIADTFETDYRVEDLMGLTETYRSLTADTVYATQVPGYSMTSQATGVKYYIASDSDWDLIQTAYLAGEESSELLTQFVAADPASFSVTVRNGSGITGSAQQVADILGTKGFQIQEIGNADQYVYEETLVVYDKDEFLAAAETVVQELGMGRTVASNGFYSFESDILLVIGKDWKPLN